MRFYFLSPLHFVLLFVALITLSSVETQKTGMIKKKRKPDPEFVPPPPPNWEHLQSLTPSSLHESPNFIDACKVFAGYVVHILTNEQEYIRGPCYLCCVGCSYYKDPSRRPDLKKTILIAGINNGYRDFFHNFKCFTDRLGIKFLPISLDVEIHNYITLHNLGPTVLLTDIPGRGSVASEPSGFGGKNFNLIGCRKMEAVSAALKLGYDVIFSDVDIALLRDPIGDLFLPGVDYTHSTNKGCDKKWLFNETMEGNTGFYAARSNVRTIRLWDLTYRACSEAPLYDDQTMFWLILRHIKEPPAFPLNSCDSTVTADLAGSSGAVVTCPLDNCLYSASQLKDPSGWHLLQDTLRQRRQKAVMIHANWMNGKDKKKAALQNTGLWVARKAIGPGNSRDPEINLLTNWTCASSINSNFV